MKGSIRLECPSLTSTRHREGVIAGALVPEPDNDGR
jgi:hypothetical protein